MKWIVKIILSILLNIVAIMILKQVGHYEFISYITGMLVIAINIILSFIIDK